MNTFELVVQGQHVIMKLGPCDQYQAVENRNSSDQNGTRNDLEITSTPQHKSCDVQSYAQTSDAEMENRLFEDSQGNRTAGRWRWRRHFGWSWVGFGFSLSCRSCSFRSRIMKVVLKQYNHDEFFKLDVLSGLFFILVKV
jgi:hypothetical protein